MRKDRGQGQKDLTGCLPPSIPNITGLTRIGGGASADVYRGEEPTMRRKVAVKVLHTPVRDRVGRQAFEHECALAGQVGQHPCAANLYTSGFVGDRPYIVMQYYTRGSLAGRLKAGESFSVAEVLSTGVRISGALQFAHNRGILHRDVKPENILCDAFGDPVLADFGIATDRDAATMSLQHAMTAAFAAPEVLQRGGGWPVSDVWSLAATLYTLLAGRPPFWDPARDDPQANQRALTGPLPVISRPGIPDQIQQALERALIGEPDSRTASPRLLAEELHTAELQLGLPPTTVRLDPADQATPAAPPRPAASRPAGPSRAAPGPEELRAAAPGSPPEAWFPPGPGVVTRATTTGGAGYGRADTTTAGAGYGRHDTGTGGARSGLGYGSPETGLLPTSDSYRMPPSSAEPGRRPRRRLLVGAAVAAVAVLAAVYVIGRPAQGAGAKPAGQAASGAHPAASAAVSSPSAPPPPADVTVTAVGATSARVSWRDTVPPARGYPVVISLGQGNGTRTVPDHSPQLIRGISAGTGYCFAVGYVYSLNGQTSYSAKPACINGGVAN